MYAFIKDGEFTIHKKIPSNWKVPEGTIDPNTGKPVGEKTIVCGGGASKFMTPVIVDAYPSYNPDTHRVSERFVLDGKNVRREFQVIPLTVEEGNELASKKAKEDFHSRIRVRRDRYRKDLGTLKGSEDLDEIEVIGSQLDLILGLLETLIPDAARPKEFKYVLAARALVKAETPKP